MSTIQRTVTVTADGTGAGETDVDLRHVRKVIKTIIDGTAAANGTAHLELVSSPGEPAEEQHFNVQGASGEYAFGTPVAQDDGSGVATGGDFEFSDNLVVGPAIGLRGSGMVEGEQYDVTFTFEI